MPDSGSADRILAMDEHIANDWFIVNVVTEAELICVGLKTHKRAEILHLLQTGAPPLETLQKAAPLLQPPEVISLSSLRGCEWHSDNNELRCRYFDESKDRQRYLRLNLSGTSARTQIMSAIQDVLGSFDEVDVPASIWHIGIGQMIYAGIGFVLSIVLAIAVHFDAKEGRVNQRPLEGRRRFQALAELMTLIGPAGILLIGVIFCAAMMAWWYWACRTPPIKTIATRQSTDASFRD